MRCVCAFLNHISIVSKTVFTNKGAQWGPNDLYLPTEMRPVSRLAYTSEPNYDFDSMARW